MKVVWSETALSHLTDIYNFISRDSARYAQRMVDRITARSKQLASFPECGQVIIECERPDIREIIEGPYRIIFEMRKHE